MDWSLIAAIFILIVTVISIIAYYLFKPTGKAFEFDNGTLQGWTIGPLTDDDSKQYFYPGSPPKPVFEIRHDETNQYPKALGTDPNSDKKGSLMIGPLQLKLNNVSPYFPQNSKWHVDLVSPTLSNAFSGITSFEAHLADDISGPIRATLLVRVKQNNQLVDIPEVGGSVYTPLQLQKWTDIFSNFSLPVGAIVSNLVIRLEGDYLAYEGYIDVDHVVAK